MKLSLTLSGLAALSLFFSAQTYAADAYVLTIKDHVFSPAELEIPANQKVSVTVDNLDNAPEEFDSSDLHREKVIAANSKGTVLLGPLAPGRYEYKGEYHEDTAKGVIVVK